MFIKIAIMLALLIGTSGCAVKTSEEMYSDGVNLLREGKSGGAIVLFKNALEKNQNYLNARYQLARAYQAEKKYELAEKEFQKVKLLNPNQPDINLDLAKLYNSLRKPDLAIRHAEQYLLEKTDSTDALEVIGIAYGIKNMPQEAETFFLRALQKEPGKLTTKLELAALHAAQGRAEHAGALLEEIIKESPTNTRAQYLLADTEITRGRKVQALAIYKKLGEINASDPVAPYKVGLLHFEMGHPTIAETMAGELINRFPSHAEGYRLKGIVSYGKKNFPEAITSLQHANKLQPSMSGYFFLGLSLYGNGDLESAMNQFRLILDRAPLFHQARLLTGIILLQQKRVDDAITELTKLLENDGKNPMAHNMLGSAYMAKGMYEEGVHELDMATKLEPKLIDAYLKKGILHLIRGKTAEVELDLTTAIQIAPELLNTRLILSSFYEYRNNRAKAFATLNEGLADNKKDAVLYCGMARIMFADNKPDEGIRYLKKAKESDHAAIAPFFMLGDYYAGIRDAGKALNEYSEVMQKEPHNVKAMLKTASLMESTTRDNEALAWYLKAKDTGEPAAFLALASKYFRSGNHALALKTCDELVLKHPKYAPAYFTQGTFLEAQGRKKEAITKYHIALAQSDSYAPPLNNLAYLYLDGFGTKEESLRLAERAIALEPGNPGIMDTVGYALLKNNRHMEARKYLEKAVALLPDDPTINYHLALAHQASGDKKRAVARLQKALRKENFAGVQQARNLLAELN